MCRAQREGNLGHPCVCGRERRALPRGHRYLRKPHGELSLGWNLERTLLQAGRRLHGPRPRHGGNHVDEQDGGLGHSLRQSGAHDV